MASSTLKKRILIVEDDPSFSYFLKVLLEEAGYEVQTFAEPQRALLAISDFKPHLVITDLKLPHFDGLEFIERAKLLCHRAYFLVITAFGSIPSAVSAIKKGAVDYLTKPLSSPEDLLSKVKTLLSQESEKEEPQREGELETALPPLSVVFAGLEEVLIKILKVAKTDLPILLQGETGTGKTLIARIIHQLSARPGPFVEINCATLPETLIESELFGYEKGAFTGATRTKPGKVELAKDGTLFLDEIGELPLSLQPKLLRLLQDRTFERLGGLKSIATNARLITATNKDLPTLVKEGKFREDLYFRLKGLTIHLPSLRERRPHILTIAEYFVREKAKKLGLSPKPFSKEAQNFLLHYAFPGNIRELENLVELSLLFSEGEELEFPKEEVWTGLGPRTEILSPSHTLPLKELEKQAILSALERAKGNKKETARLLGIPLRTLYHKLKEYGLS